MQIEKAYFNLVAATIAHCFSEYKPILDHDTALKYRIFKNERTKLKISTIDKILKVRMDFINSQMVKMWCDCAEVIDHKRLVKLVELANKKLRNEAVQKLFLTNKIK